MQSLVFRDEYNNYIIACRYETIMYWIENHPNEPTVKEYIEKYGVPKND